MALLDLSTGELAAALVDNAAKLLAELARAEPREVLLPSELDVLRQAAAQAAPRAAVREDAALDAADVESAIDDSAAQPLAREALQTHSLAAVRAVARALRFARHCTPGVRVPVRRIVRYDPATCLAIDETAQLHLELVRAADGGRKGSLLDVIDETVTPPGARLLRRRLLAPLVEVAAIRRRLEEVEVFVTHPRARGELRDALRSLGDLERLSIRALLHEAGPRELAGIRDGLEAAPKAVAAARTIPDPSAIDLVGAASVDVVPEVAARLLAALVDRPPPHARDGGVIRDGFDASLDELRGIRKRSAELILALEGELRTQTGAPSLRIRYTRVFGWYIEVTRSHLGKVPPSWRRKQTVAGGERYTNEALDDLADRIEHAEERSLEREATLIAELADVVERESGRIRALAELLSQWDVAAALAEVAHRYDYAKPVVDDSDVLAIVDGRHPVVERLAAAGRFVPNDTRLDLAGERMWLVTGPNMAGKSTLMRQVALIVILAQMGSYVPASEAQVGLFDRVLSRVGASDNVARGESTFMVEMRETASILRDATRRSLVILDEIGRGTSTYDGLAIAWAVAEHLYDAVGCRALFATHYHELTLLAKTAPGVANMSVSAREHGDDVVFLHKLVRGAASRSYGIAVARLSGIAEGVLARAKAILAMLESGSALPGGSHASLRGRGDDGTAQLDLFAASARAPVDDAREIVETLHAVDIDRLTPLDALQLLSRMKGMLPRQRS
jgi:DNA mismatch repair protein MutS